MVPLDTISTARSMTGKNRIHMASMQNRPARRATSTTARASSASTANGFSQSTALPALRLAMVCSAWRWCGVATYTTSIDGSAISAS